MRHAGRLSRCMEQQGNGRWLSGFFPRVSAFLSSCDISWRRLRKTRHPRIATASPESRCPSSRCRLRKTLSLKPRWLRKTLSSHYKNSINWPSKSFDEDKPQWPVYRIFIMRRQLFGRKSGGEVCERRRAKKATAVKSNRVLKDIFEILRETFHFGRQ